MTYLKYYYVRNTTIELIIFNKYLLDDGIVVNKKTGKSLSYSKNKAGYNQCTVTDDNGKPRVISIGRAIISSFGGPPPTPYHTVDHKNRDRGNDTIDNLRWLCKSGQIHNRVVPMTNKSAFIIVKDNIENTTKDWVDYLKKDKNHLNRRYTDSMIRIYAHRKQFGFSYKEYPDLPNEIWKEIVNSNTAKSHWKISNMCRVKYITNHAENVISGERLRLQSGYPIININGKNWRCHVLVFMTFFPEEYANKKSGEMILHEDDDKMDFRPHKLRLGTQTENTIDAYNNGCHDGTKTERMKCSSYINGMLEKEHQSQDDAVKYLKTIGFNKASKGGISGALKAFSEDKVVMRYGRTWRKT